MLIEKLEKALANRDTIEASRLLVEMRDVYDDFEESERVRIAQLDPVYKALVAAQLLAQGGRS